MNTERDQNKNKPQQLKQQDLEKKKSHSSAFKETSRGDEKSTTNVEEDVQLEQERKDAITQRD
jgi:hypothetical protein